MSTSKVRLWFVRETLKARQYSKIPASRGPTEEDMIWLPLSQIEHTTKREAASGDYPEHTVTIPDWLADKNNL